MPTVFDQHANLAYALVTVAPAPALTGLTITVDDASLFPAAPFNATVWPDGACAYQSNAEIVRVTGLVGNTFTIVRAQEGTTAKPIAAGWQFANTITVQVIDDIQNAIAALETDAVIVNPATSARNVIQPTADVVPLTVRGAVGQTALLQRWEDSAAALLAAFTAAGVLEFGAAGDTNLYRESADRLRTDDAFAAGGLIDALGPSVDRVQTITITGSPTGGSFTLTANIFVTAAIPWNATAAQVQAALRALPVFSLGDTGTNSPAVTCAGGPLPGTPITVTYSQALGGMQVNYVLTSTNSLTGGTAPAIAIVTTTPGITPQSDRTQYGSHGVYLPAGASIRAGNLAGTSWIPLLMRASPSNFVLWYSGAGSPVFTLDTNNRVGIGAGNSNPGTLVDGELGSISFYNAIPTYPTTLTVRAGAAQGTKYLQRFMSNAGGLLFLIDYDGSLKWGGTLDVNLYRGGANQLKTDDDFAVGANQMLGSGGYHEMTEIAVPTTPAANKLRLFSRDSGAGMTQLVAVFPSGNTVVIAEDF